MAKSKSKSKYNNKKTEFNGITFHSKKECDYYKWLLALKEAGDIKDIRLQPEFIVFEGERHISNSKFKDIESKLFKNKEIKGKQQDIKYIADFEITLNNGDKIVVDVKSSEGNLTEVYRIKRKLFLKKYPEIEFFEAY